MKKIICTAFCIIFGGALVVYGIRLYDHKTLPGRLTSSIKDVAIHGDIFAESKLIESHQEGPDNLNGDGSMEGTFRLPKEEVEVLLADDPPLHCPAKKSCQITKTNYGQTQMPTRHYYATADVPGGTLYQIGIDTIKSQVSWSVTWY